MPGPGTGPQPGGWETLVYTDSIIMAPVQAIYIWKVQWSVSTLATKMLK